MTIEKAKETLDKLFRDAIEAENLEKLDLLHNKMHLIRDYIEILDYIKNHIITK